MCEVTYVWYNLSFYVFGKEKKSLMLTVKKNNDNGMGITATKFCEQDTLYINNKTGLATPRKFSLVCSSNIHLL